MTDHHAIIPTVEIARTDLSELPSGERDVPTPILCKAPFCHGTDAPVRGGDGGSGLPGVFVYGKGKNRFTGRMERGGTPLPHGIERIRAGGWRRHGRFPPYAAGRTDF